MIEISKIYYADETMELRASAGTPILYREMFKKDLIKTVLNFRKYIKESEEETEQALENGDQFELLDFLKQLAFIMNLEATVPSTELFKKLTFDNYLAFLCSYDDKIFTSNTGSIMATWSGSNVGMSESKNTVSPQ